MATDLLLLLWQQSFFLPRAEFGFAILCAFTVALKPTLSFLNADHFVLYSTQRGYATHDVAWLFGLVADAMCDVTVICCLFSSARPAELASCNPYSLQPPTPTSVANSSSSSSSSSNSSGSSSGSSGNSSNHCCRRRRAISHIQRIIVHHRTKCAPRVGRLES